jgi:hypothetical protein
LALKSLDAKAVELGERPMQGAALRGMKTRGSDLATTL